MKRSISGVVSLVLTASLITAGLSGCSFFGGKKEAVEEEPEDHSVEVSTELPEIRDVAIKSDFSAKVEADDTVVVVPKTSGEVIEKNFEIGDHVREGELLFKIDDETAKRQVEQAKANVDSATAGYTAEQAKNASTKAQATETIAKISSNEAQLDLAVDNAYAQKRTTGNAYETYSFQEDYYEDKYYEAKDDLSDTKKKRKKLNKRKNELSDMLDAYDSRVNSEGESNAKDWLKKQGYSSPEELKSAYNTAVTAYNSADAAVDQYEDAVKNYDLQKRVNGYTADSNEMNYYTGEESVALAQQNLDIYRNFTKASTLFGVNASVVGADASLVNSEATMRTAKTNLANAETALENCTVTAPVSGTITDIKVSLHNMVSSATEAYTIETDAKNKIVFYVAEGTIDSVKVGNDALVTKNGSEYAARITEVGNTLDQETGLFKVEAAMVDSTTGFVNGSTVSIKTVTRETKNAVTIPGDAVYYDDEQAYVFLSEGNKAVRRDVETGISDENGIVVTKGLGKKDNVIVSWSSQLRDGVDIKVVSSGDSAAADAAPGNEDAGKRRISDPADITAGEASTEINIEEVCSIDDVEVE